MPDGYARFSDANLNEIKNTKMITNILIDMRWMKKKKSSHVPLHIIKCIILSEIQITYFYTGESKKKKMYIYQSVE